MLVLILDSAAALNAAGAGVELCIKTLIPSLFPFFIFSIYLTGSLGEQTLKILAPLEKLCRIPRGSGSLLITGMLGGYPVGAQSIALACESGSLSRQDARRMLAFCNNAGPAFLFGMIGQFYDTPKWAWLLWTIHMVSALAVSALIPGAAEPFRARGDTAPVTLTRSVEKSVRVMAVVCGWVIFFRVILGFLDRWILWLFPTSAQVFIKGILELSNGCVLLGEIPSNGLRFLLADVLLAFGGLCVTMQTRSVCGGLSMEYYLPGKLLQASVSLFLGAFVQVFFPLEQRFAVPIPLLLMNLILTVSVCAWLRRGKNKSSIPAAVGV